MDRQGGQAPLQQMFALAAAEPEVAFGRLQGRGADADGLDHGPGGAAGRERSLDPSRRGKGRVSRLGPDRRPSARTGQGVPAQGDRGPARRLLGVETQAGRRRDLGRDQPRPAVHCPALRQPKDRPLTQLGAPLAGPAVSPPPGTRPLDPGRPSRVRPPGIWGLVGCGQPPAGGGAGTVGQRAGGERYRTLRGRGADKPGGSGSGRADRVLALMHNPVGAILPGSQRALEVAYRGALSSRWGVTFDRLYVLTNMPIQRFRAWLERTGQLEQYQQTLESAFDPGTVGGLMCRTTLGVSWDGTLSDCDFNRMLDWPVQDAPARIEDVDFAKLSTRRIATGAHCFGCTAGAGSSCGGQLE